MLAKHDIKCMRQMSNILQAQCKPDVKTQFVSILHGLKNCVLAFKITLLKEVTFSSLYTVYKLGHLGHNPIIQFESFCDLANYTIETSNYTRENTKEN